MVGRLDVDVFGPGPVGIVSRSSCLAEETAAALSRQDIGQSTCLVTSSALVAPTRLADVLGMLEADPETEVIVMIGGVGGGAELEAARFIKTAVTKPIAAFLPGRSAPAGIDIGADGDFALARVNEIQEKTAALRDAGVTVAEDIDGIVATAAKRL
jgi:succinyl-CoA synthetase alpha subunit